MTQSIIINSINYSGEVATITFKPDNDNVLINLGEQVLPYTFNAELLVPPRDVYGEYNILTSGGCSYFLYITRPIPTPTPTPSITPTMTQTPTETPTSTPTPTVTPTLTKCYFDPSPTPTNTLTSTITPTPSITPSLTKCYFPPVTPTPSVTTTI